MIYSTKNYDQFKVLTGNRALKELHIKKLMYSVEQKNLLKERPILVNEKMEVIDGQHRLEVCRRLNIPVSYILKKGADAIDVQRLNTSQVNWSSENYLEFHIKRGNENYSILKEYCKKYTMPIGIALTVLSKSSKWDEKWEDFRSGLFEVNRLKEAEDIGEEIMEYRKFTEKGAQHHKEYYRALLSVHKLAKEKEISVKKLLHKLEVSGRRIERMPDTKSYLRFLEGVYNFKSRVEESRFF